MKAAVCLMLLCNCLVCVLAIIAAADIRGPVVYLAGNVGVLTWVIRH